MASQADRDLAAVTGALIAQGRRLHELSCTLTAAALIGLLLAAAAFGQQSLPLLAVLAAVAAAGLGECYLAVRTGFDAALLRRLADDDDGFDRDRLDAALLQLRLMPPGKAARPLAPRLAGARRLFRGQGLLLVLQVVLIVAAAAIALAWPSWGG
jgi:hypothetical protein